MKLGSVSQILVFLALFFFCVAPAQAHMPFYFTPIWIKWGWLATALLLLLLILTNTILNRRLRRKTNELSEEVKRHKQTAQKAREREQYTSDILNHMNDYLFFHDLNGNFLELNASAKRASGYTETEWKRMHLKDIIADQFKEQVEHYLKRVLENGNDRGYLNFVTKYGSQLILEYNNSVVYDEGNRPVGVRGICRNITDQLKARKALKESERKYRKILESIEDGYYEVDLEGNMQFFNDGLVRMLGYEKEELNSLNYKKLVNPNEVLTVFETFNYVYRTGKPVKAFNWQLIRKDGSTCLVETSVSLNRDEDNRPTGFRGIVRDVTERHRSNEKRRELESQLHQAQKMESIGTLAGGIAHDFNNILFPLIGYTELSMQNLPEDDKIRKNLEKVIKSANRARDLVQQILTFSRQSAEQDVKPVRIQSVVKESIKLLRNTVPTTIEIRSDLQEDTGKVLIGLAQIHQVVMNLCTNALHAMEHNDHGKLVVTLKQIEVTPGNSQHFGHLTPGPYVRVSVADNGCGIKPEIADKIFEPYFTTKPQEKGTGLGLSVSYGIVKKARGAIEVDSTPDKGSRFDILLPVVTEEAAAVVEKTSYTGPLPKGSEHVLLVDDEQGIVELEKELLESLGYRVTPRTSSIEALEAFRYKPEKFDLLITDQTMPNMAGLELIKAVREIRPELPVILCTGYSEQVTQDKVQSLDIQALILKPIAKSDMAVTMRNVLDRD